ncbi:MAG: thiaminase/transcriptional activator TenA [Natronomonas sp.]|jgi:thiaminase/transcriptional activator TenA|uniref:TenA family protein n=1 Tax=Natronomonas sp. TaxID=2184060 RepID=UPI0039898376
MTPETDGSDVDRPETKRFSDHLRERSDPAFSEAVEHPFVADLGAGTLDPDAFAAYLVQDYAFLDALVGTFGFAVGEAPGIAAKRPLIEFLDVVTDAENDYFERSFEALDVPADRYVDPERTETTEAFIDLLGRAAREGGYAETLAVLVPAEWIYESWALAAVEAHADPGTDPPSDGAGLPFYYAEWIDLHATDSFRSFVGWLRGQLDSVGPELSPPRRRRVERLFSRTVELEVEFFDTHYPGDRSGSGGV